jgi:hypothetical protein
MPNLILPKERSKEDQDSIQQPIAKDGWTNDRFDKLYGHKTKNPWSDTERNRALKKSVFAFNEKYADGWTRIFGKHEHHECPHLE